MSDFTPVEISTRDAPPAKRVPLFSIDGQQYTIPQMVPPNITIAYLRDVTARGEEYALAKAMQTLLGEESMDALADCAAVGEEEMTQIMWIVSDQLFSAMRAMAGKSRPGRRS